MKTAEQQGLQAIQRSRELLIGECTALSNHLRGILFEFGVAIPQGFASLLREDIESITKEFDGLVKQHPVCKRLTAIEGIGPIGALSLYAVMRCGKAFTKSREFSAYLELTPRQYSSGGNTNIVGISRKVGNKNVRTAWAMATQGTEYQRRGQLEMAAWNVLQTETCIR